MQFTLYLLFAALGAAQLGAQAMKVPMTPEDLIARNLGPRDHVNDPFPAHKIIGNIYFVGPQALGSFLITTPAGNILVNSDFEVTVPGDSCFHRKAGVQDDGYQNPAG